MQFQGIPSICPQRVSAKEVADCADIQIRVHLRKFVTVLATGNLSRFAWTDSGNHFHSCIPLSQTL